MILACDNLAKLELTLFRIIRYVRVYFFVFENQHPRKQSADFALILLIYILLNMMCGSSSFELVIRVDLVRLT